MRSHPTDGLRFGVIGCSAFGARSMLPVIRDNPATVLTAVASRYRARAEEFAARFGGDAVAGYRNLLARDDVEAVYIALPNALHHEMALAALDRRKHVLAEKPLTTRPEDTAELIRAAATHGLVLRENYGFEHHGQHERVRALVREGHIGRLRHVESSFCYPSVPRDDVRYRPDLGGGALLDVGVYPVRAMQYFLGDDLTVAGAVLRCDPALGVDVAGSFVVHAADGVIATGSFGLEHGFGSRYRLWGSSGQLVVERAFTPPPGHAPTLRIESQNRVEELTLPAEHQLSAGVSAFAAAVGAARAHGRDPGHEQWAGTAAGTAALVARIREVAVRI
ncbi:Gfo/Idh/MocA family protein [Salinispora oceanensis]|uniref:Gfo/Idh/MocA family protein n=1 Tax=Salinispora oceanensis TaxID=1050199 RepID=UPI00036FCEE5|nr:Gfo/Idh/MocA family oxidoreductase [Salinispora oceanensis]